MSHQKRVEYIILLYLLVKFINIKHVFIRMVPVTMNRNLTPVIFDFSTDKIPRKIFADERAQQKQNIRSNRYLVISLFDKNKMNHL